ncbi:MAG: hypothetical protein KKF65_00380 [Nanoarchaeota archaeon]|nr:hypothetical protein [Nanoarchaeota archaeon]
MIILSNSVLSIGLSSSPLKENPILFEPYLTFSKSYTISKYKYEAEPYIEGDLAEYVSITNHVDHGTSQTFTAVISLPEKIEPAGLHHIYIGAREIAPSTGGISTLTRTRKDIGIMVLYDEKKARFSGLNVPNINENEICTGSFVAESLSKQKMYGIKATVKLFDYDHKIAKTFNVEEFNLESAERKTVKFEFDTTDLEPGQYNVEAEIFWESETDKLANKFNIGTLFVEITNYTNNFTAGQINKITIDVESKWKGKINDVFAQLFIDDEEQTATQSYTLDSFEKKKIVGYLDLTYTKSGDHNLKITLNFDEEKTTIEGVINVEGVAIREPLNITITSTEMMMFLVIIVLILIVLVVLFERKRAK